MDGITTPIESVLDLFSKHLADVRFADVDSATLTRLAAEVKAGAEVVAAAQAALESAKRALEERQEALLQHVQRAVAYARVYAENDQALTKRLDEIALPRPSRRLRNGTDDALVLSPGPKETVRARGRSRRADAGDERGGLIREPTSGVL